MAGASGYCPKGIGAALLRKAVKVVRKGELWVSRGLTHHLLGQLAVLTDILKKATTPEGTVGSRR
jgi:DNA-binding NarL/FixJ family response regulator